MNASEAANYTKGEIVAAVREALDRYAGQMVTEGIAKAEIQRRLAVYAEELGGWAERSFIAIMAKVSRLLVQNLVAISLGDVPVEELDCDLATLTDEIDWGVMALQEALGRLPIDAEVKLLAGAVTRYHLGHRGKAVLQ